MQHHAFLADSALVVRWRRDRPRGARLWLCAQHHGGGPQECPVRAGRSFPALSYPRCKRRPSGATADAELFSRDLCDHPRGTGLESRGIGALYGREAAVVHGSGGVLDVGNGAHS
jgi:hypothetical protein